MRVRSLLNLLICCIVIFGSLDSASAGAIKVGPYLVNTEGALTASSPKYEAPLNLGQRTRLVVQIAPQYAIDFGIIPAADIKKWRAGQAARFYFRLTGQTDSRYITLDAGSYYIVARDLSGGVVTNGFALKVRKFTGKAKDEGLIRTFVSGFRDSRPVLPNNWNGFTFQVPAKGKLWFDGVFSRGMDRRVKWEILTDAEYRKFISGASHQALLAGNNPALLGFHFMGAPGAYYFLLINSGSTYSAYSVVWEKYR